MEFGTAILAQVITINGQPVVMEDLLEMEMSDLNVITEAVMGEVLSPTRKS
jgi:hypothetical protein